MLGLQTWQQAKKSQKKIIYDFFILKNKKIKK